MVRVADHQTLDANGPVDGGARRSHRPLRPRRQTMRIAPIEVDAATGRAKELMDEIASRGGEPGPMVRAMADAPAVFRGYLDLSRAVKRTHLDRRITERTRWLADPRGTMPTGTTSLPVVRGPNQAVDDLVDRAVSARDQDRRGTLNRSLVCNLRCVARPFGETQHRLHPGLAKRGDGLFLTLPSFPPVGVWVEG